MSNANTFVDALRTAGLALETPPSLSNPGGNNPTLFTWPAGTGVGATNAGAPVVLSVPVVQGEAVNIGSLAGSAVPESQLWYGDKSMFRVRALGRVQPNATGKTLKIYLFTGNGLPDSASGAIGDKEVGLLSAVVTPSGGAFSNWFLEATCLWDSNSLQLTGTLKGCVAGTLIAETGFSIFNPSAFAAQQAAGSYNPIDFVIGANIASTANPNADVVTLDEFSAEAL